MRFGFIIFTLLMSCSSEVEFNRPIDLVSQNDMKSLIVELEILESYYSQNHKRPILYQEALDSSIHMVLNKYKIDKDILSRSLDYYSLFPDSIYLLYETSLDSVNNLINTY